MQVPLPPWMLACLVGILGQLLKFVLYGIANRRFSLRVLVTTNGMPSLYALVFGCLASMIWAEHGLRSPSYVACFVLSGMILHDSVRLRGSMDRGSVASFLLAKSIPGDRGLGWLEQFRPYLGDRRHRPLHVAFGLILGTLCGLLYRPGLS